MIVIKGCFYSIGELSNSITKNYESGVKALISGFLYCDTCCRGVNVVESLNLYRLFV